MLGPAEAVTSQLLRMALNAATMRHTAIANNIANVNTAGYAPVSVNFEQQLDAVRGALGRGDEVSSSMLSGVQPVLTRGTPLADTDRDALLDIDIANLAQNTVQFDALLKAMGKHMSILLSAVTEGKR
jgi:flagellar basal-body rod protein FlgB